MSAVLETLLRAASGEQAVLLHPELARQLLACTTDAELATALELRLPQRIRARNEALVEAARILSTDGCATWQAAQRLAQAVRRFERALLPALRAGQAPTLTPHEGALWRAYQARGARSMRSARKLYELLRLNG